MTEAWLKMIEELYRHDNEAPVGSIGLRDVRSLTKALRELWARIDFLERRIADLGGIPTPAVLLEIEHEPDACEAATNDAGARDDRI